MGLFSRVAGSGAGCRSAGGLSRHHDIQIAFVDGGPVESGDAASSRTDFFTTYRNWRPESGHPSVTDAARGDEPDGALERQPPPIRPLRPERGAGPQPV